MTYTISPRGPEDDALAEHFFQCLGRALYVATLFEQKCSWVSWVGQMVHEIREDPNFRIPVREPGDPEEQRPRLNSSINALLRVVSGDSATELRLLHRGREARNTIIHNVADVGPLDGLRSKQIERALQALRNEVQVLAEADALASSWAFAITEREHAPVWLSDNYAARLVTWIFGGPHDALNEDRQAHEVALYERLVEMAKTAMQCPCCDSPCKLRSRAETAVECGNGHKFQLQGSAHERTLALVTPTAKHDSGARFPVPAGATFP